MKFIIIHTQHAKIFTINNCKASKNIKNIILIVESIFSNDIIDIQHLNIKNLSDPYFPYNDSSDDVSSLYFTYNCFSDYLACVNITLDILKLFNNKIYNEFYLKKKEYFEKKFISKKEFSLLCSTLEETKKQFIIREIIE